MTCLRLKLWVIRLKLWVTGRKQSISPFDVGVILSVFSILLFFFKMVQLGSNVGLAFALSIGAGLSTCIGGLIIFFNRLIHLASPKTLAISLSLSAGVMIFISLVEIFGKSVESYQKGFQMRLIVNGTSSCGEHGFVFINKTETGDKYHCSHCDTICEGHSWLATTATFILGVLIIFLMDYIVGIISPAAHDAPLQSTSQQRVAFSRISLRRFDRRCALHFHFAEVLHINAIMIELNSLISNVGAPMIAQWK